MKILLMLHTWPAASALNYSVNDIWNKIKIAIELTRLGFACIHPNKGHAFMNECSHLGLLFINFRTLEGFHL